MITEYSSLITFRVDPLLSQDLRKSLDSVLSQFKSSRFAEFSPMVAEKAGLLTIDLVSENSLHLLRPGNSLKICLLEKNQGLFSFDQNIEDSVVDAILDESFELLQLQKLIEPSLSELIMNIENNLYSIGSKNLRKFESKVKQETQRSQAVDDSLTSEGLLGYAQSLVSLEKELIHALDIERIEKVIKQFVKNHFEKTKIRFFTSENLAEVTPTPDLLTLPRYKGQFLAVEMNWNEQAYPRLIKKLFFFYTLVNFFSSKQEIKDPFFDDNLWENVLDGIPFPVALLSPEGQVYQHNSLFSKLNLAPADCLKFKAKEKSLINDIPYNIFRKDIHHLDENKILFVFFTESFFLKGEGNLTPSGQELGIISSSIAHELNNPIAGIQAALSLLMLDPHMDEEARATLTEMKSGAMRCKQLIETFLGFSRANPTNNGPLDLKLSPVEVCYQQAQNLLRFRTVESGIRFSFDFSQHSTFRAEINLSLLTMTFYLIFGELMTLYSHQLLIADKNQIEKNIKGEIIESSQEIQIQLHELNISNLNLSKLIHNLLTIESFSLQTTDYSLRFIYSPSGEV